MSNIVLFPVNVIKHDMPVNDWLKQAVPDRRKVGGLLDYGYSPSQISHMLNLPLQRIRSIMLWNGFRTLDEMPVKYQEEL